MEFEQKYSIWAGKDNARIDPCLDSFMAIKIDYSMLGICRNV